MKTIADIEALMADIYDQIADSENIPDKKGYSYIAWYDFLKTIKRKLENEKYKFVFIGKKGIGKTTTILELFGFNKTINGKHEDLLTTAAGGTTTCEVELLKSSKPNTYFEIEPIDNKLLDQYIDDFCASYDDTDSFREDSYLPSEISRSIRNMIGLKKKEIKSLFKHCKTFEEFRYEVIRRIDIEFRTKTIIDCNLSNGTYFKDCQAKFNEINLCKIKDVLLPRKIKIYLTKDTFDFDKYPMISSIVDTRGIDTTSSSTDSNKMKREDILNYIDNEADNCLFFFVDNIKPAPSQGISELLKTRLSSGNEFKFFLIVNVHGQEAEEVMTDDGKAGSMQVGIDYKKDDIIDKFKQLKIRFLEQNLLFYNARLNQPQNNTILLEINDNLSKQIEYLYDLSKEVKKGYEKLKYDFENNQYAIHNFDQLHALIEDIDAPNNVFEMILDMFIGELQNIHHARLAAINRYEGEYWAFNFYHEISLVVEKLFDDFFLYSKEKIVEKVNEFMNYRNIVELDRINYRVFLEKFERDYNEYRSQLKEYIKDKIKSNFRKITWDQAVEHYGHGRGYTDRVLDIYANELKLFASKINVPDNYNERWDKIIYENSL